MDRAIEVGEGEGGAHSSPVFKVVHSIRHHHALWMGVLYAITIVVVLAAVAKLY